MDGLSILLGVLTIIFLFLIFAMNWKNYSDSAQIHVLEGFAAGPSPIETQVRAVLDNLTVPEICPLYATIRTNMKKNEMSGPNAAPSDADAEKRVEANLNIKIPGGALPCPLLTYPRAGSTDLDWLDFVQKIPIDYGARIVFMAIYAKDFLGSTESMMKDALAGKGKVPASEGFVVCSPDVADTRKAEKAKSSKSKESCDLPEDLTPEQLQEAITIILKQLVAKKTTVLTAKKVDPQIDILPLIKDATKSAEYLNKTAEEAQSGNLQMTAPIQTPTA